MPSFQFRQVCVFLYDLYIAGDVPSFWLDCHKVLADSARLRDVMDKGICRRYGLYGPRDPSTSSCLQSSIRRLGKIAGATEEEIHDLAQSAAPLPAKPVKPEDALVPVGEDVSGEDAQGDGQDAPDDQIVQHIQEDQDDDGYRRCRQDSPLLSDLIQVVEFSLKLGPQCAKQKVCRREFPTILRSDILAKWTKRYHRYELWRMDPEIASKLRSVPNWWLDQVGLDNVPRRARDTIAGIPADVAQMVQNAQGSCIMGCTDATKRADPSQSVHVLRRTINEAMQMYIEKSDDARKNIIEENSTAWTGFKDAITDAKRESEEIPKQKVRRMVQVLKSKLKKVPRDFSKWKLRKASVYDFQRRFMNRRRKTNTAGNFLTYDDPRMIWARKSIREVVEKNQLHWGMVLRLAYLQR